MQSSQHRLALGRNSATMLEIHVRSELMERPVVGSDGGLELKLRGIRVVADGDSRISGLVNSVDGVLRHVRIGDLVEAYGCLASVGCVAADAVHLIRPADADVD